MPSIFGGQPLQSGATASQQQQAPSIFAKQAEQPQQTSLFGKPFGQPQQLAQSIFSQQPAATSGFLKPAATQEQQQQQTSTLFGKPFGQPQQSTQSVFSQQPAGASSLFKPVATQNQQQQQSTTPAASNMQAQQGQQPLLSLFGTPASKPQLAQPSIFAPNTTQQQQSLPLQNQAQQTLQQTIPPGGSQPAYFDALLERGRKRNNAENDQPALGHLPGLHLGLSDISRRVRELGGVGTSGPQAKRVDSKAHYLVAASGISPGTALRDLKDLNAQTGAAGLVQPSPGFDPDTGAYIAGLQSQSTLALISEGLNRSVRDFDAFLERSITMDWDAQRQRIYEHFGLAPKAQPAADESGSFRASGDGGSFSFGRSTRRGPGQAGGTLQGSRSAFGPSALQKSVIGSPGRIGSDQATMFADTADKAISSGSTAPDDRFLREKQGKFADGVQRLNEARLQDRLYPVLKEFASVEKEAATEQMNTHLVNSYDALIKIVKEDPSAQSPAEPNAVRERQYADDYLDETPNSAKAIRLKKQIVDGSRRHLEKQFFQELEALIAKHPREARLGGVPTVLNKVRAYVNVRAARKELCKDMQDLKTIGDKEYYWAIIFFLLRTGHTKEAVEYVEKNTVAFKAVGRNFPMYIAAYHQDDDRRLRRDLANRINGEYAQRARIAPESSRDFYELACYKIIGRCDLSKRNLDGVPLGVEDWIWLQFNLAREVNRVDEAAGDVFGLDEVRDVIRDIGQRHFVKGQEENAGGYGMFFYLQILGGMFEQAVAYLYPFSYTSAVHFAIALDYYGLLRVSDFLLSDSELLTFNTKQLPQISFGRMLGYYTRDFRSANVEAAVDYLTLICLNGDLPGQGGRSQTALCHEALRELVLETREFARLLGDIRADGQRIKGAIEKRLKLLKLADQEDFLGIVTRQAAVVADEHGRTTDAVLLYHLAEEYDNVIVIINRALSEAIAVDIGNDPVRLQPLKPRAQAQAQAGQQQQQQQAVDGAGSSLSLTSVDDQVELARNMIGLYNQNALYYGKIKPANRDACGILLRMSEVKQRVEAGQWAEALDMIDTLSILPLRANNQINLIRSAAQSFNQLPTTVARNVGPLLIWTVAACAHSRDALLHGSDFEIPTRNRMAHELAIKAKDVAVFAGLIRYHLPASVFEVLARAGGEVEGW